MEIAVRNLLFLANIFVFLWFSISGFPNHSHLGITVQPRSEQFLQEKSSIEPGTFFEIQPGDILLIRGTTWVDKAIKLVTRSPYSHVVGVVNSDQVVEILPFSKAKLTNVRDYSGRADVFTCKRLSSDDRKKIVSYATRKIGTSYDYYLLVWEASRFLLHWVWPYENTNSSLCSTLWSEAYRNAGIDLCPEVKFPAPGDLAKSKYLNKVKSI